MLDDLEAVRDDDGPTEPSTAGTGTALDALYAGMLKLAEPLRRMKCNLSLAVASTTLDSAPCRDIRSRQNSSGRRGSIASTGLRRNSQSPLNSYTLAGTRSPVSG